MYLFYISSAGKKYHKTYGCSGARTKINAYNAPRSVGACSKCKPACPDLSWYKEYVRVKRAVKGSNIGTFVDDIARPK